MRGGDVVGAESLLKKVLKKAPKHGNAWFTLGNLYVGQGKLEKAQGALKKAVTVDPRNAAAWLNLGSTQRNLGQPKLALPSYAKALALAPQAAVVHSSLGSVLKDLGRLDEAKAHCRQAVALEPGNSDGHVNLGVVLKELGDLAAAEGCYREAIKLNPDQFQAHVNLGLLLEAGEDPAKADEAIACFNRAVALRGQNQAARAQLGHAYLARGRFEDAAECYGVALSAQPTDWQLQINYGIALAEVGHEPRISAMAELEGDVVYADMAEPKRLGTELATGYPVPSGYDPTPLNAFFAEFEPTKTYPASWWQGWLDRFGPREQGQDKMLRGSFAKVYGWSLPSAEALDAIASFVDGATLASYGAGSGYWEYLLQAHHGVSVDASDLYLKHRFVPMRSVDFGLTTPDPGQVVMFAWIIEAKNVVDAAMSLMEKMVPGQKLILMGDRPDDDGQPRTCGTPALFNYLERHFEPVAAIDLVSFSYLHDGVDCYTRKGDVS